jgi:hypothetical protein
MTRKFKQYHVHRKNASKHHKCTSTKRRYRRKRTRKVQHGRGDPWCKLLIPATTKIFHFDVNVKQITTSDRAYIYEFIQITDNMNENPTTYSFT